MKVSKNFGCRRVRMTLALIGLIGCLAVGSFHNGLAERNHFNGGGRANAKASMPMAVRLNPNDISNFTLVGTQVPSTGPNAIVFDDQSSGDVSALFANDPDAAPGTGEVDLVTTFQVLGFTPFNVDADFRVVINDGVSKAAIAACVVIGGQRGIGLAGPGIAQDVPTYLAFFPINWAQAPVTIRLRRTNDGGCELMEVNGTPPSPRVFLTGAQVAPATRATATAELGCFSAEGLANVQVSQFYTEKVAQSFAGSLTLHRMRIRDSDTSDRLRFRGDFTLAANTDGINPSVEQVMVKLSTSAGTFYDQTLNGFDVRGNAPKRRWSLNAAERARTGIERLDIDEDPNNAGAFFLRDMRIDCGMGPFDTVNMEISIGSGANADKLTGTTYLVEHPRGTGSWRLYNEP